MILVCGAGGAVGRSLSLLREGTGDLASFDPANGSAGDRDILLDLIEKQHPEVIINCHESASPDEAETHREEAYASNSFWVKDLARICFERGLTLVHLGSAYVFDGRSGAPLGEEELAEPISTYGDSKLLGERFLRESGCRHLILRVGEVYGDPFSLAGQRFVRVLQERSYGVEAGRIFSPTWSDDIAAAILALVERGITGTFHFAARGETSPAGFIASLVNLHAKYGGGVPAVSVEELGPGEFLAAGDAPRTMLLDCSRYEHATGTTIRDWRSALEAFVAKSWDRIQI